LKSGGFQASLGLSLEEKIAARPKRPVKASNAIQVLQKILVYPDCLFDKRREMALSIDGVKLRLTFRKENAASYAGVTILPVP
jgi:hypothetical protein